MNILSLVAPKIFGILFPSHSALSTRSHHLFVTPESLYNPLSVPWQLLLTLMLYKSAYRRSYYARNTTFSKFPNFSN